MVDPIVDTVLVKWSNEMIRPAADRLAGALILMDQILVDVRPDARDFAAQLAAADPTAPIADGAPADGRSPLVVAHLLGFVKLCQTLQTMADDDRDPTTGAHTGATSRGLIHRVAVNPRT